jgi:hypothetical protein
VRGAEPACHAIERRLGPASTCRDQILSRHDSERSAVAAARQQLISVGDGELVIHGDDGRVALVIRYARPVRRADLWRLDPVPGDGSRALRRWG